MRKLIAIAAESLAYVLIAAALIGLLAAYTVSRRGWTRETLRKVAAQELANFLGGAVSLGPVTGDIWHGMTVQGFSVADASGRQALAAEQLHVDWNLPAILRGTQAPSQAIRRLRIVRPYVCLVQDEAGHFNLERLYFVLTRGAKAAGPPPRLVLEIVDGTLEYDLRGPKVPRPLRRGRLYDLKLTADTRRPDFMLVTARGAAAGAPVREVSVKLGSLTESGALGVTLAAQNVNIGAFVGLTKARLPARVLAGLADCRVTVYRGGRKARVEWSAALNARGVRAQLSGTAGELSSQTLTFYATPRTLWLSAPVVKWGRSSAAVDLGLQEYARPSVALRLRRVNAYWPEVKAAMPASSRQKLDSITFDGWVRGEGEFLGPKDHGEVQAFVAVGSPLTLRSHEGATLSAAAARFRVAAHDLAHPGVTFEVELRKPSAVNLPETDFNGRKHRPQLDGLGDLLVTGTSCGGTTLAATTFSAQCFRLGDFSARNVAAKLGLSGDVLRLSEVSLETLGGRVTVAGFAGRHESRQKVVLAGSFQDVDLSTAARRLGGEAQELGGRCDGRFTVVALGERPQAEAFVVAKGLVARDYAFGKAAAMCRLDGQKVTIPWLLADNEAGPMTGAGELDLHSKRITLRFAAGPVEIGSLGAQTGFEGWSGKLWSTGILYGTSGEAKVQAEIVSHRPCRGKAYVEAVYAQIEGNRDRLTVPVLLACRDGAVAQFSGELTEVSAERPYAHVWGELHALGVDVASLFSWLGSEAKERPTGLLEAHARVNGTLAQPEVEGDLKAAALTYRQYHAPFLGGSFSLASKQFEWKSVSGVVEGVHVSGAVSAKNFASSETGANVEVSVRTEETDLSRIMLVRRQGLELDGRGAIRQARLHWEGDRLASATALGAIEGLRLGNLTASAVELNVRTEGREVVLLPARIRLANGLCQVSGRYDTEARTLGVTGELTNCALEDFLSAAASATRALTADRERGRALGRRLESWSHRVKGPISGIVTLAGPTHSLHLTANFDNLALALNGRELPQAQLRCAYDVAEKTVRDLALEARYGEGLITAEGSLVLGGTVRVFADASALDVRELRQWLPWLPPATGTLQVTCLVTGDSHRPVIKGSCDIAGLSISGARLDLASVPVFTVQEGGLSIDTLVLKRGPHELVLHGRLPFTWDGPAMPPDQPVQFRASFDAVDLPTFVALLTEYYRTTYPDRPEGLLSRLEAQGVANGTLNVAGTLREPRISGVLEVDASAFKLRDWSHPLRNARVRATLTPTAGGTEIALEGPDANYAQLAVRGGGKVILRATQLDRLFYNDYHLVFSVTAPEQTFAGGTTAKDLALVAALDTVEPGKARLFIRQGSAKLGAGKVVLTGTMDLTVPRWSELERNTADLLMEFDGASVRYSRLFDGLLAGTVRLSNPQAGQPAVLSSRLTLSRARVSLGPTQAPGELYAPPPSAPNLGLDLTLDLGQDVTIRGAGLHVPVQPAPKAVVLTGSLREPSLRGFLSARQGRASLPGGFLSVKHFEVGMALSTGPPQAPVGRRALTWTAIVRGEAERVLAQTEVNGRPIGPVHIYLRFAGELPGEIRVSATSDPPLAEQEIYAILGAEPFGGLATGTAAKDLVSEQFASLLGLGLKAEVFEPLEAELRAMLGLSEFQITFALNQPVEVRVGKYLLKDLLVSYQRSLAPEAKIDWWLSLSYEVGPGMVVGYYTRSDGEKRFTVGRRRTW